jgi:hypothetical protein
MKAADIVTQLRNVIPRYTNLFSDTVAVTSLSYSAGIVTCVTTTPHGLITGDIVYINGALTPITITSLTQIDNVATAITASNHDFTDNYTTTVDIIGATQAAYNGTHTFIHQPNRRTFEFEVTGNPVTPATGTHIYTLCNYAAGYNGSHVITRIDDTTFTYPITSTPESPAQGTITIQCNARISGAVSIDRIIESYTKQTINKFWMWVVLGDVTTSKDRFTQSDATYSRVSGQDYRQRVIAPFSVYVAAPCSSELGAMSIRDEMDYVNQLIFKTILNYKFVSPYNDQTSFGCITTGHSPYVYSYAYYVHEFKFEVIYDVIYEDTVDEDTSVAFRDLNFGFLNDFETNVMQTNTNLDDVPLTT